MVITSYTLIRVGTLFNNYDIQIGAGANINIQVDSGNVNITGGDGKMNLNSGGDFNLKVGGNYTMTVSRFSKCVSCRFNYRQHFRVPWSHRTND